MATLLLELDEKGPTVWQRFRASAEESVWFYRSVLEALAQRLGEDHALVRELARQVTALGGRV